MKQTKKELTDDEKFEQQLQAEQELGRLARTYTILERNRTQFSDTGGKLSKQRKVIDIFKKEQKNILTDLAVASADARKKEDQKRSSDLSRLLKEYDQFDNEIKIEKAHLHEVEGQIKIAKKKVLDVSAKQITDEQFQQRAIRGEKTLQTLENKLEVQVKKFCAISSENVKLREEINHLLIERHKFNKIWDTLINNLAIGKKFMLDLIEQATIAYDQREEWVSKLQSLRTRAHNDLVSHIQEMRILQRKRDNDAKLQEFFAVKGQKRVMRDLEEKEQKKRAKNKDDMEKKLERYLQMLCAIVEFTGEEKVSNIAKRFLDQEQENFSMFKYVNHMNKDMEVVSDQLGSLHIDIDEQKAMHELRHEQQQHKLEELRQEYEDAQTNFTNKDGEMKEVEVKLKNIMKGIGDLFKMFKCKNDPLLHLLGNKDTIHNYSVLLYLEILERNIQEYLVAVYYKERNMLEKKKMKTDQMLIRELKTAPSLELIEEIVHSNPCPLCVEHEQVSDVIDCLQVALTKQEVKEILSDKKGLEEKLHNVSECHLPKSRQIIQKRYQ